MIVRNGITYAEKLMLEKVNTILSQSPGGEEFFNILDNSILNDMSDLISLIIDMVPSYYTLILTGKFGKHVSQRLGTEYPYRNHILCNGGIRKGTYPEILSHSEVCNKNAIMIDDSFYSGKTYETIKAFLSDKGISLNRCVVMYDGSKDHHQHVNSLFRYWNFF